jgi:hypothetical protein
MTSDEWSIVRPEVKRVLRMPQWPALDLRPPRQVMSRSLR